MNDELNICKSVECMLHQEIRTPKDFMFLHEQVFARTHVMLSVTTLKRVWGYVSYDHAPSLRTLNTLAQFLGFQDYKQFREKSLDEAPSDIVISNYIDVAEDLAEGDELDRLRGRKPRGRGLLAVRRGADGEAAHAEHLQKLFSPRRRGREHDTHHTTPL